MTRDLRRLLATAVFSTLAGCASSQLPDQASEDGRSTASGWRIEFGESGSNPVIVDGVLYVGSADGAVYALDPKTLETKWRFQTGENLLPATSGTQVITVPRGTSTDDQMSAAMNAAKKRRSEGRRRVDMTPTVENGTVFIGSGDHSFYAIDATTGKKKWSYLAGPGMDSWNSVRRPAAVLENGTVYFVTEDGLHALDARTGKRKWLFETLQEVPQQQFPPAERLPKGFIMVDGVIFLTAGAHVVSGPSVSMKNFLYAVDQESGKSKWVTSLLDSGWITAPATARGLVFFAVEPPFDITSPPNRETLYAVRGANGQVAWKIDVKGSAPTVLIVDRTIYFCTDKSLLALELETGRQLWSFSADEIISSLRADDQHIYVVTHKGSLARPRNTLHALALTTGLEKWSQRVSGYIAMIQDSIVYASGKQVHAIDASTGQQLWSFQGTGRESPRLVSEGRIFLTSPTIGYVGMDRVDQGYLSSIDAKTGKP